MKKGGILKAIILFLIILFFLALCFLLYVMKNLSNDIQDKATIVQEKKPQTIEEIIEMSNSEYLEEKDNTIYLKFGKDLFDEKGNSNENYFNDLIEKLKPFYENKTFALIDNSKNIKIDVIFSNKTNEYSIIINDRKNYFKETDGKNYIKANTVSIDYKTIIPTTNNYLQALAMKNMNMTLLKRYLDEGKDLENGYMSYNDDTIQIRTTLIKTVRNVIFTKDFNEEDIITGVKVGTPLKKILELYPENTFGSINQGYLGYLANNFYYFFYDDETSVYGLTYKEDSEFEEILAEYLDTKDLDKFVTSIKSRLRYYDYLEYDPEIQKAHIMFSSRGYEIDIEENNPKGIVLYNNYYFTDKTKEYVKNGEITLKENMNSVEKIEKDRRNGR